MQSAAGHSPPPEPTRPAGASYIRNKGRNEHYEPQNIRRLASFSPTQRKACAVLAVCVLAVILTFIASWVLPGKLSLGGSGRYDPQAYPLDTSLGSVLAKTSDAGTDYVSSSTLFVGDQFAKSLYDDKVITLDQFAGKDGLTVSSLLNDACVYFAGGFQRLYRPAGGIQNETPPRGHAAGQQRSGRRPFL